MNNCNNSSIVFCIDLIKINKLVEKFIVQNLYQLFEVDGS